MDVFEKCGEMNERQRGAYKLYWGAIFGYCILLPIAVKLAKHFHDWRWKPLFMVLPLIAVILILRAMMTYFSAADEMQRRILAEGCAYAFAASVFATVALGFFEGDTIPVIPWSFRFVFMMFAWGISVQVAKSRYK